MLKQLYSNKDVKKKKRRMGVMTSGPAGPRGAVVLSGAARRVQARSRRELGPRVAGVSDAMQEGKGPGGGRRGATVTTDGGI